MDAAARDLNLALAPSPWYFPGIAEYAALLEKHSMEATFATLFDRPTPLQGEDGLQQWIRMFGQKFLAAIVPDKQDSFLNRVDEHARLTLYRDGQWFADYRRLRIAATNAHNGGPMPETFLILLCGGVMFAAFVPKSTDVTRHWLRLCGVIAITTLGLSALFWSRRSGLDRETLAGYFGASS